jgi:hypothetical protein
MKRSKQAHLGQGTLHSITLDQDCWFLSLAETIFRVTGVVSSLLTKPSETVRLYDSVSGLLRKAAEKLDVSNFPTSGSLTNEEFTTRIQRYEESIFDLTTASVWPAGRRLTNFIFWIRFLNESLNFKSQVRAWWLGCGYIGIRF